MSAAARSGISDKRGARRTTRQEHERNVVKASRRQVILLAEKPPWGACAYGLPRVGENFGKTKTFECGGGESKDAWKQSRSKSEVIV